MKVICLILFCTLLFPTTGAWGQETIKNGKQGIPDFDTWKGDGLETRTGLFTVYRQGERWYLGIPDSLLGREVMIVSRIAKAATEVRGGAMRMFGHPGDYANRSVFRFEKIAAKAGRLMLRKQSYHVQVQGDNPDLQPAIDKANILPLIASFEIKATAPELSIIDITEQLNGDNDFFYLNAKNKAELGIGTQQVDRSYLMSVDVYPQNIEIRAFKTFTRNEKATDEDAPGNASMELHSSIVLLPEVPMKPRYSDERIGYFNTGFVDYTVNPHEIQGFEMIARWRLEPRPEDMKRYQEGKLVEPRNPIVFYIDPTTPEKWIPYLIQGINDWQVAFEKAGFKNAIIGKRAPTYKEDSTWQLEDARHSAIVYKMSDVRNASGPRIIDPRSGEILEAHINWHHNVMKLLREWYFIQASPSDPRARALQLDDKLMGELIRFISSHEIGHSLGLEHNFTASSATPVEKLRDREWLKKNGHTASIMDYARFNYVAQPEDRVGAEGIFPRINDYDKWAIEWGYRYFPGKNSREEVTALNRMTRESLKNPRNRFYKEHPEVPDAYSLSADLGDNVMKANAYGIKNLKFIVENLPQWYYREGESYEEMIQKFDLVRAQYKRYVNHVVAQIGGLRGEYRRMGETGTLLKFNSIEHQQEALHFLSEYVFKRQEWMECNKMTENALMKEGFYQDLVWTTLRELLNKDKLFMINGRKVLEPASYQLPQYLSDLTDAICTVPADSDQGRFVRQVYTESLGNSINLRGYNNAEVSVFVAVELRRLEERLRQEQAACTNAVSRDYYKELINRIQVKFTKND